MVFMYDTPLDVSFFSGISDSLRSRSELFYAPRHPQKSPEFDESASILDQIEKEDKDFILTEIMNEYGLLY